jgi:hypothetical protein
MSTAAITINQSGKPAGVSNQSRDDLDLYTAPGTEIQLSNSGVGGTTFQWSIIDQPPGAAATLTTPLLSTTLLTGATVAGSYLVQLVVDGGGSIGQIKRLIGAVQVNTPSWVTPALNRPLRIPACGETNEFNVETSPGVGVNLRGWAQEMSHFFLTIANFAFGSVIKSNNVQVGAEAFLTFNFSTAFTVSDAGSGQANIGLAGSVGGLQPIIDQLTPTLSGLLDVMGQALGSISGAIGGVLPMVAKFIEWLSSLAAMLSNTFEQLAPAIAGVMDVFSALMEAVRPMQELWISVLVGGVQLLGQAIAAVAPYIVVFVETMGNMVKQFVGWIREILSIIGINLPEFGAGGGPPKPNLKKL